MELLKKGSFLCPQQMRVKQIHFFPGLKGTTQNFSLKAVTFERYVCTSLCTLQSVARLPFAFIRIRKYREEESQKFPLLWFRSIMYFRSHCKPTIHSSLLKGLSKGKRNTSFTSCIWKDWGDYIEQVSL